MRPVIKRLLCGAAAAIGLNLLQPEPAAAFVLNTSIGSYDVTTFTGSQAANASSYALPANGGAMPWWGNRLLATEFSLLLGNALGVPNSGTAPFFAYTKVTNAQGLVLILSAGYNPVQDKTVVLNIPPSVVASYAVAAYLEPVPGPLAVLALPAVLFNARQLRKRLSGTL